MISKDDYGVSCASHHLIYLICIGKFVKNAVNYALWFVSFIVELALTNAENWYVNFIHLYICKTFLMKVKFIYHMMLQRWTLDVGFFGYFFFSFGWKMQITACNIRWIYLHKFLVLYGIYWIHKISNVYMRCILNILNTILLFLQGSTFHQRK